MWILDRIDDGIACLECTSTKNLKYVDLAEMPKGIKAGCALEFIAGKWEADAKKTESRKGRIEKMFKDVSRFV